MNLLYGLMYILLAPIVGGILAGIDRKVSARMQGRVGPPVMQPFYDVAKLFGKQDIVVNTAQKYFVIFFLVFMVLTGIIFFSGGDILLVIFSLTLSSIFLVIGAYASNSPYSDVGAQRELAQMMAYEPMILLTAVGFYLATHSFNVKDIIQAGVPAVVYLPGIFIGFTYVLTVKFRKSPFDLSTSHHGHQELVKGITTEFSGVTLGLVEVAHWYENVMLLGFVYIFFAWAAKFSIAIALAACLITYFLEILIDNVFARFKWNLVVKTCWIVGATLGFVNVLILTYI